MPVSKAIMYLWRSFCTEKKLYVIGRIEVTKKKKIWWLSSNTDLTFVSVSRKLSPRGWPSATLSQIQRSFPRPFNGFCHSSYPQIRCINVLRQVGSFQQTFVGSRPTLMNWQTLQGWEIERVTAAVAKANDAHRWCAGVEREAERGATVREKKKYIEELRHSDTGNAFFFSVSG